MRAPCPHGPARNLASGGVHAVGRGVTLDGDAQDVGLEGSGVEFPRGVDVAKEARETEDGIGETDWGDGVGGEGGEGTLVESEDLGVCFGEDVKEGLGWERVCGEVVWQRGLGGVASSRRGSGVLVG
jgi:hypothetical protein